jgi:hypothetical protein
MKETDTKLLGLIEEIVHFPGNKPTEPTEHPALDEVKKNLRTYAAHKAAAIALDAAGHEDADKHWRIASDAHQHARLVHRHGVQGETGDFTELKNHPRYG